MVFTTPKVVEDDRESPASPSSRPNWAWLLVGLALGAGAAVIALGVDDAPQPSETTAPADAAASGVGGLAETVNGFPDGLIAATRGDGRSLELLVWPVAGEPYSRGIAVGTTSPPTPVVFDASARRIATVLPLPRGGLDLLYAGIPQTAGIVATDVTGFAWHDSEAYQLAFTTWVDGELLLWVLGPGSPEPELIVRAVGIEGGVAAWGDWGFAVEDEPRGTVVLFTESGEIRDTNPGRVLASRADGWLAIENGGVHLLSAGGGVDQLDDQELQGVLTGRFSPTGESLAVLGSDGVAVVSLDQDRAPLASEERPGVPRLAWSSDGRFLLYPGTRGLRVFDTEEGGMHQLMTDRTFTGLEVLPLSD